MWVTILVGVATFALSSWPSFTGDWEAGRFNFLRRLTGETVGRSSASRILDPRTYEVAEDIIRTTFLTALAARTNFLVWARPASAAA
jgi:hypothetical protein